MDIENVIEAAFAAAILNAPRDAARSRGTQTVPDIIDGERADLWHTLPERAAKIIARYVRYEMPMAARGRESTAATSWCYKPAGWSRGT